jgi:hypothetical protein
VKEALERMQVFVLIWINTHSLDQVLGGKPKLSEIPENPRKCIETKMVRSVTINREVHQWAEREIKLQPVLNKNLPTTQSLSCRGLVTVMAKIGIAPIPKT